MKVALAHDFVRHGGAERVLEQMHLLWPDAPVYTLLYEENPAYADWTIRSTWLQRWVPPSKYRWPFPYYPRLVDRIRVPQDIDLLVTSSVSWMKSLPAPEGVPHLCYIHRPMMFAYERQADFLATYPAPLRPLLRFLAGRVRDWDLRTSQRPTLYAANSAYTAQRVRELYRQEPVVIHPPVRVEDFEQAGIRTQAGDYFLTVLRLESYKRVDIIVEACAKLDLPLKVAGRGPEMERLKAMAGPKTEFLGFVPDQDLPALVAGCKAFLFSAEEDFGIAPVEAQAAGRPVLAFGAGGCLETVLPGKTGLHFERQEADSLIAALEQFQPDDFDPEHAREHARSFSEASFRRRLMETAKSLLQGSSATGGLAPEAGRPQNAPSTNGSDSSYSGSAR
ncbi:MAG: glycosyltransferase family 4 protein [Planctomycetota bacterium]|nr:MAG: glycosyltransferase family 4 protein [Planctomycetota bacterium]